MLAQAAAGPYAVSLGFVVALVFLALIRVMDPNEKEPLWAISIVFVLGAFAGMLLPLLVRPTLLELSLWWSSVAREVATFAALGAGLAVLGAVARWRGWSEVNGPLDGVVYGAAVGLGTATGAAVTLELLVGAAPVGRSPSGGATLAALTLAGLAQGLFGAVLGAGFGVAARLASPPRRLAAVAGGLVGAVLAHAAYLLLAWGDSLGGGAGRWRAWLALLLPLAFVAAMAVLALRRENAMVRRELAEEVGGVVTEEDLELVTRVGTRRGRYLRQLLGGDFDGWLDRRTRHNRLVQLALTKERARAAPPGLRSRVEAEAARLRAALGAGRVREPSGADVVHAGTEER
jgi:protease PrsW